MVNAAPTANEGDRVHRMLSAMVGAGVKGGYLVNPMLADVHWQAGERPVPAPAVGVAGESSLWVDPSEIPSGPANGTHNLSVESVVNGAVMGDLRGASTRSHLCCQPNIIGREERGGVGERRRVS
jgi:hypothetical protein